MRESERIEKNAMLQVCTGCCKSDISPGDIVVSLSKVGVEVAKVPCLGACSQPRTIAIRHPGKYTWVIGHIDPLVDGLLEGLSEFVRLYELSPTGDIPWSDRPLVVRQETVVIAKIPPT